MAATSWLQWRLEKYSRRALQALFCQLVTKPARKKGGGGSPPYASLCTDTHGPGDTWCRPQELSQAETKARAKVEKISIELESSLSSERAAISAMQVAKNKLASLKGEGGSANARVLALETQLKEMKVRAPLSWPPPLWRAPPSRRDHLP